MKILVLASNPRNDLSLGREIRELKEVLEMSFKRRDFEVETALAVRVTDLQDLLLRHEPQIVHFCGHGSGQQGLIFESDAEKERLVETEALSELFRLVSGHVKCVLLNACYSEVQANAIISYINFVIGMNQEIQDKAAIAFSKGFYRALGYGRPINEAFDFGRNAIQLEISGSVNKRSTAEDLERKVNVIDAINHIVIPEHLKPILKTNADSDREATINSKTTTQPLSEEARAEIQLDIDKLLIDTTATNTASVTNSIGNALKNLEPSQSKIVLSAHSMKEKESNQNFANSSNHLSDHYSELNRLLKARSWVEADNETRQLLLKYAASGNPKYLSKKYLEGMRLEVLDKINQLWIIHSDSKYGFTVQKAIYVDCGGELKNEFSNACENIWIEFCNSVGWRQKGRWVTRRNFEILDNESPRGYFPSYLPFTDTALWAPRTKANFIQFLCLKAQYLNPD